MKEIRLLKQFGPTGVVSMFYKGSHTNLVELTKNGLVPLLVTDSEYEDALKRGFGVLIKRRLVMVTDIANPEKPRPGVICIKPRVNVPRPHSVIKNDTLVIKEDESDIATKELIPEKKEEKKSEKSSSRRSKGKKK